MSPHAERLINRARELATAAPEAFAAPANTKDVAALKREMPGKLVELVAERAERCLKLLDTPSTAAV